MIDDKALGCGYVVIDKSFSVITSNAPHQVYEPQIKL